MMEENQNPVIPAEDEIDLGAYFAVLRKYWWKIALLSLAVGIVTLIVMFQIPNRYEASAVITPATDEKKPFPALGALASFGIEIGGPAKIEDLEALFKSNDLTVRVFKKHDIWPIVAPGKFDPKTGRIMTGWVESLLSGGQNAKLPSDWDAIRAAKTGLTVKVSKKLGNLSISFESPSPEGSAYIVRTYLDEAKSRLQEEALDRAKNNKKFIEEQINRTVDALTRDRMFSLYGQEVEREMLAKNLEQFGFRIIDTPRVPDRKSSPNRFAIAGGMVAITFFLCCFIAFRKR